jgi:hypothetical protein
LLFPRRAKTDWDQSYAVAGRLPSRRSCWHSRLVDALGDNARHTLEPPP